MRNISAKVFINIWNKINVLSKICSQFKYANINEQYMIHALIMNVSEHAQELIYFHL
jgi:hypothetical protein